MWRWIALAALVLIAVPFAALFLFFNPPKQLSIVDGIVGGARGTERVGTAIAFGGKGQTLDVWAPASKAPGPRPVVIFWYGGGWVKGDRDAYAFAGRAFASKGYVVVIPDYRKVPQVRFPAFLQDGADAVKWTRDNVAKFGGDPSRIAFAGHSAGAYTAIMLALDTQWLEADGVAPGIAKAAVGLSGPYDFYPFTGRAVEAMGQAPDPQQTQPINFARADAPPLLLVTSTKDTTVRPKNAINLAARLTQLGAPATLKSYDGLDHEDVVMALSKAFRSKAPVLDDSVAFLHEAMSDKPRS